MSAKTIRSFRATKAQLRKRSGSRAVPEKTKRPARIESCAQVIMSIAAANPKNFQMINSYL